MREESMIKTMTLLQRYASIGFLFYSAMVNPIRKVEKSWVSVAHVYKSSYLRG
jgi:hypothetical protein